MVLGSPRPVGWLMLTLKNVLRNLGRNRARMSRALLSINDADQESLSYEDPISPEILFAGPVTEEEMRLLRLVVLERIQSERRRSFSSYLRRRAKSASA